MPRTHRLSATGGYFYDSAPARISTHMYSMILTGIAMYKTEYQHMFATVPPGVYEMIDKFQNCEDISFNVMVADHLKKSGTPKCPGVFIEPTDLRWLEKSAGVYLKYLYHVAMYRYDVQLNQKASYIRTW